MKITKYAAALSAVALVGALAACAPAESPNAGSGGEVEYENLTLKINTGVPPTHHLNQNVFLPWKDYVEEATDGHVTVELYDANTLGSLSTVLSDMESGLYDVGIIVPTFFLDSPLYALTVANLVAAAPDQVTGSEVIAEFLAAHADEIEVPGVDIVGASVTTLYQFWSKNPIDDVSDINGLQVRVGSAIEAQAVELLGAVPVQVPPAESYQALERGTVQAAYFPAETSLGFKLYEVAPHLFQTDLATTAISVGIRSALREGMSDDLRALFDTDLIPQLSSLLSGSYGKVGDTNDSTIEELVGAGSLDVTEISSADKAAVARQAKKLWDDWAAEADSRGLDGEALVNDWLEKLEAAGGDRPF